MPQKLPSDALVETSETLLYSKSMDAYEVDIDDKDLHIDLNNDGKEKDEESTRKSSKTQVESTSKRKSQQSQDSRSGKNNKKNSKKNENAGRRRATKSKKASKDDALVIEKTLPSPSPWVTPDDPSITPDIPLALRQLIEFYVNPLQELPESIDIG